jgi:hypothetical protein
MEQHQWQQSLAVEEQVQVLRLPGQPGEQRLLNA